MAETVLTADAARTLADRILDRSGAAEAEVRLWSSDSGHTRFAANQITTEDKEEIELSDQAASPVPQGGQQ